MRLVLGRHGGKPQHEIPREGPAEGVGNMENGQGSEGQEGVKDMQEVKQHGQGMMRVKG